MRKEARWVLSKEGKVHFLEDEDCIKFSRRCNMVRAILLIVLGVLLVIVWKYWELVDGWVRKHVPLATEAEMNARSASEIE